MNSRYRRFLFQSKSNYHIYVGEGYTGSVEPHRHEFHQCMYIIEGQILENQFGREILQRPGECFFTPINVEHSLYIFENTRYYCLSFSQNIADILFSYFQGLRRDFQNLPSAIKLSDEVQGRLCHCFECLLDEQSYDNTSPFQAGHFLVISALIIMLRDAYTAAHHPFPMLPTQTNEEYPESAVQRVIQHINANYDQPLSVDELVHISMLSKSAFYKAFQQCTGQSVKQYLVEARIKEAMRLMSVGRLSLNEISHRVGYDDFSTFYRNFVKVNGVSPAQYRSSITLIPNQE